MFVNIADSQNLQYTYIIPALHSFSIPVWLKSQANFGSCFLRDNPTTWQTFSAEMADTRGPTKHLLLRPATKGNLFLGRRGLKIQYHWARIATSIIPSQSFSNSSWQREHKNVEVNCKKILLAPWCRGFAAFTLNILKNQEGINLK